MVRLQNYVMIKMRTTYFRVFVEKHAKMGKLNPKLLPAATVFKLPQQVSTKGNGKCVFVVVKANAGRSLPAHINNGVCS